MFGSAFLGAHLMRGAAAAALLAWAIVHQTAHPWLSLGAGVAALVALRGCPMCWTVGLVETLSQGRRDSTDALSINSASESIRGDHAKGECCLGLCTILYGCAMCARRGHCYSLKSKARILGKPSWGEIL